MESTQGNQTFQQPATPTKGNSDEPKTGGSTEESATQGLEGPSKSPDSSKCQSAEKASEYLESQEKSNEEGGTISLSQVINDAEKEERLQSQLLNNRLVNECRFNDGYVYQQVFSCKTCYDEQVSLLPQQLQDEISKGLSSNGELGKYIQPHGFCLACMRHCHDGHEINELYTKVDFKCDCGNGRMPFSCSLMNEKPHFNEANAYDQTFFDSYCYCKKSNYVEESEGLMIQCYDCEDWYHHHHLTPPMDETPEDKYILLCKLCINKKYKHKIIQYKQHLHPKVRDFLVDSTQLEPSTKRQRISENTEQSVVSHQQINCSSFDKAESNQEMCDILIDEAFMKFRCNCNECQLIFSKVAKHIECIANMDEEEAKLQNNLEGQLNTDPAEDSPESNRSSNLSRGAIAMNEDYLNSLFVSIMKSNGGSMSQESQIYLAENLQIFKEKLVTFLKRFDKGDSVVQKEDIQQFFQELMQERDRTFIEHMRIERQHK